MELSLREKIGQMLCFAFHGTTYNDQLATLIEQHHIGNIVHFARNITSTSQVAQLNQAIQAHATHPVFISLDQEGGMVRRIVEGITYLPGAMSLAASQSTQIRSLNATLARNLQALGFHINYAPVADINNNVNNPVINSRSYGDDPKAVSKCVVEAALGLQEGGILPTVKHFPGHGDTNVDSHLGLPIVTKSLVALEQCELMPFREAIMHGLDGIMISHILFKTIDSLYPSSLSHATITGLLRKQMGFQGLITTDSLTMQAIWGRYGVKDIVLRGVLAGNDILVFCGKATLDEQQEIIETFVDLVESHQIPMDVVDQAVKRILLYKSKYIQPPRPMEVIDQTLSEVVTRNSITCIVNDGLIPLKQSDRVLSLFPKFSLASLVDNETSAPISLKTYLNCDEIIYEDVSNFEKIVQIQDKYDKIILATYQVKVDDPIAKLYHLLDPAKTMIVALRSPYDLLAFNQPRAYVCTYDVTKESIKALTDALKTNHFDGVLPIQLK